MSLYGDDADVEFSADLFVQATRHNERHNLPFPTRERGITIADRPYFFLVAQGNLAPFDGIPDNS